MRQALDKDKVKEVYKRVAGVYDFQHGLLTARSDQKGRRIVVNQTVHEGDSVLDCGSGTGSTGILAAKKAGRDGKVTFFDLSDAMLSVAKKRVIGEKLQDRVEFKTGDMVHLPFKDNSFDVVLSTYSLCPLYNPVQGALELYRVTRPGGRLGIGHSSEPKNRILRFLADRVESLIWRFPRLSLECRSVQVLPDLERAGGRVLMLKHIGIPLWPFLIMVIEKPLSSD